jgi:hypothetical protein
MGENTAMNEPQPFRGEDRFIRWRRRLAMASAAASSRCWRSELDAGLQRRRYDRRTALHGHRCGHAPRFVTEPALLRRLLPEACDRAPLANQHEWSPPLR